MFSSICDDDQPISISSPPKSTTTDRCASKNIFQTSNKTFQELIVLKKLNKAKFPVYLARSKVNHKIYAMKAFPYEDGQLHPYYENEIRFSNLRHPNVISTLYSQDERKTKTDNGSISMISYKIMDYAPYGDFFDFVMKNGYVITDKWVRTYFKQLIEGLEYLHHSGVSHMDIKLENLLIGENFMLKITDFDLSKLADDGKTISKGTKFYRAPELIQGRCKDTYAADIYSAGIVLFAMKTQGILPHTEGTFVNGVDFARLLHTNDERFWEEHCKIQDKGDDFLDEEFKELFLAMTCPEMETRATIETIKKSKWYNGPCYTQEELKEKMERIYWY